MRNIKIERDKMNRREDFIDDEFQKDIAKAISKNTKESEKDICDAYKRIHTWDGVLMCIIASSLFNISLNELLMNFKEK